MRNYKRNTYGLLILFSAFLLTLGACKKKARSDMGKQMYDVTKNKIFKNITPDDFDPVFQKVLTDEKAKMNNPQVIADFYQEHDNDPVFVMDHLKNGDLKALGAYLSRSGEHGLDPKIFNAEAYNSLLNKFYDKKAIKTTDEAYQDMARLEVMTANAYLNYANALQYGLISPRRIYARYYTKTIRPDSSTMKRVLKVGNIKTFLDSIQPKNPQYLALQKALAQGVQAPGMSKEETQRELIVNLERLRWKNKPSETKYVIVNIPDYRLDVMDNGNSVINMKVCVGEGRNKDNQNNLTEYDESDKVDRPFSRETPQLNSMIYEAQVNPIWNIPQSIVSKEIVKHAEDDPYYLANNNIEVYRGDKKIEDTEGIDWSNENLSNYSFKQKPGDDNSLGKIKFLFPNKSSVYLHDTPAKAAFNQTMRAVSHGCVRLEKPVDFAHAIFGDGPKFSMIQKLTSEDAPNPTDIALNKKVPVYITYVTCWADQNGALQFRPDVYGLDIVLYGHLQKYATA
ncbi:L,D-transpeptidase family protein [Mucilaginibacter sp. KACC 22063]|uniref:L,D-transpeptidase family protein n=1 Tax=Mucilaginibacter sp. KACC 22063 TaxID=3025666 RepID=UPI0023654CFC|nr:L,D-transpeptidase family protein [Mucilaginibacter sp. KACC 22063]WDF54322.1 L,D-transpeptidase family protein [Mucilaginibacter sp. KACC 22063]